jgi:D-alanyl-D-alanine carboxypeptidase (penicillin-binding protein 5/6)
LDEIVTISKNAAHQPEVHMDLQEGERWKAGDLLSAMMLRSCNDAAVALAEHVSGDVSFFCKAMTEKAGKIGAEDTVFGSPNGLDSHLDDAEHHSTAYDMALIGAYALGNDKFREIIMQPEIYISNMEGKHNCSITNTDRFLQEYSGAIGVKTGYTKRSGRCLVSAACRDGLTLLAVTLDAPDDWNDHMQLLDYGYSLYSRITLCEKGAYVTHVPLSGGVQSYVVVTNPTACAITLPKARGSIVCRVELPRFVFAPIESGYTLGRLVFYCDTDLDGKQEYLDSVNLVTRYEVDRTPPPTIWTRILHFFKQFFN